MSDETSSMLFEAALRIFSEEHKNQWAVLQEAGFDKVMLPEAKGGAAMSWTDAAGLLMLAGKHAADTLLGEAMLGHWLLNQAGIEDSILPTVAALQHADHIRLAKSRDGWRVDGKLTRVPWGDACTDIALIVGNGTSAQLIVVARHAVGIAVVPGRNLAGEPRDSILLEGVEPRAVVVAPFDTRELLSILAVMRSALMAGAIERCLELSVEYANLRVQFGRQIGKFQAVQQSIAYLATQAAAAKAATEAGSESVDDWMAGFGESPSNNIACASAKIRTGEAASQASAIAHQVFGAIGFTVEHELHRYTQRLWSWRDECGNEAYWSRQLGERILAGSIEQSLWREMVPTVKVANFKSDHSEAI